MQNTRLSPQYGSQSAACGPAGTVTYVFQHDGLDFENDFFLLLFLFLMGVQNRNFFPSLSLEQWLCVYWIPSIIRLTSGCRLLSDRMSTGPAISGLVNSLDFTFGRGSPQFEGRHLRRSPNLRQFERDENSYF